jgi:hypothetical protein
MVYSASTTLLYLLEHPENRAAARSAPATTAGRAISFRWPALRRRAESVRTASTTTLDCGQLQSRGSLAS